ncbi:MAG TPA: PilT/PilU family type 4a pilus ATPase, partial [Actinomycetota bacterium]|nr:PilT/PilU family type 4a pilus ATPase [Actinomycetota bacterium]
TREQLGVALERQRETGQFLGKILLEMGLVDEGTLVEAVARQIGVPFIDLTQRRPTADVLAMVPAEMARKHAVVPAALEGNTLILAMAEPTNVAAVREIAAMTGLEVKPALAVRRHIHATLDGAAGAVAPSAPTLEEEFLRETSPAIPAAEEVKEIAMHDLLERTLVEGASDLHLTAGVPPTIRVNGRLLALHEYPILHPVEIRRLAYSVLTQRQREKLENDLELDLAYTLPGRARFRVNVYFQRDAIGAAFRLIPTSIRTVRDLGLPTRVAEFARLARGLVLVTGPTGHGKSTTLAALIDLINTERNEHIMTIEDPIEYLHQHKASLVNQREVGSDTKSFAGALRHVLRQDPDVILVGEMRDLETIQTALTAAETGHLVFATLHTQDAPQTIDRIIDVFPPHQQQQVRVMLAASLQGIVTQQLLPTQNGSGRAVACEVLVATPAIRNLIREGKSHMIYSALQAGAKFGMQSMDQSLGELVRLGKISYQLGLERAHNAEDFNKLSGRG